MNSPTNYVPTDSDRKFAESSLERTRLQAAAYLPQLLDALVEKALHPTATAKNILDAADFTYKASGLAKRQEEQVQKGPSFQVRIILPGQNREITIGGSSVEEQPQETHAIASGSTTDDFLDAVPSYVKKGAQNANALSDDLELDLGDFDDE